MRAEQETAPARTTARWLKDKALWLIIAVSMFLRVGGAIYLGDVVDGLPGTYDQISYDALAQNVAGGKGFVFDEAWYPFTPPNTPTAHWSFVYTSYLAAVYFLAGHHPLLARLIQAVLMGVLMPWLVYRVGKRTFGEVVGLAGAAGIAVYIYLVYYSGTLMTEPFYIVATLWALDALQRIAARAREGGAAGLQRNDRWLELGVALGLATLLRQQVLLLVPVFVLWLWRATRHHVQVRHFVRPVLLLCAVVVAFILPWTARNYVVYGRFLPLNSNVGWALFAANHPQQGNRFEPLNLPALPPEIAGMNEAEANDWLTAEGIRFVIEDPGRFLLQTLDRPRNLFRFWPEPTSSTIANVSRVLSFGLYLPFMLYGLVLSVRPRRGISRTTRGEGDPSLAGVLYVYVATYLGIHLLSWAMHRYRLPVDAVMMVFVGLALVDLAPRLVPALRPRPTLAERREAS
jgi:4-amino-4-deoxy-L-arabinose transferase-like glycosyltransferase